MNDFFEPGKTYSTGTDEVWRAFTFTYHCFMVATIDDVPHALGIERRNDESGPWYGCALIRQDWYGARGWREVTGLMLPEMDIAIARFAGGRTLHSGGGND
jgi:hypothetical protein